MKITVIGAGSWGTALAIHFSLHGHPVSIWARNREQMAAMQNERENQRYLPGFPLPDNLTAHTELTEALEGSELVLMVTSVAGLRDSVELIKQAGYGHLPILTACKGFELDTGLLTFQVVREILPDNDKIGVLSGPSFAQELAKQLPCAVVLASENEKWINGLVQELNTPVMRLYANTDIIGAAVGGAVKNVMAIATGLSDGLGLFRFGFAHHQTFGDIFCAQFVAYEFVQGLGNRHVDLVAAGGVEYFVYGGYAFGDMADFGQDLVQGLAGSQAQADFSVTRQCAGAGEDEVAHAGQPHHGFLLRAQCDGQTGHFGQAARNQCGSGVHAVFEAV